MRETPSWPILSFFDKRAWVSLRRRRTSRRFISARISCTSCWIRALLSSDSSSSISSNETVIWTPSSMNEALANAGRSFHRLRGSYCDKTGLPDSNLVPTHQQDGFALWIEGICHVPCASIGVKPQFLHIRVSRAFEGICIRSPKQWAVLPENDGCCFQLFPNRLGKPPNLRSEEHTSELQSLRHLVCRL